MHVTDGDRLKAATSEGVFGSFDGACSTVGVLAGLIVVGSPSHAVLVACAGLAVASAASMCAGDYLAGKSIRLSVVMGLATLVGSLVPAVPVIAFPGLLGVLLAVLLVALLGAAIAEVRSRTGTGRLHGYLSTFTVLIAASVLAVAVSLLLGVAG